MYTTAARKQVRIARLLSGHDGDARNTGHQKYRGTEPIPHNIRICDVLLLLRMK